MNQLNSRFIDRPEMRLVPEVQQIIDYAAHNLLKQYYSEDEIDLNNREQTYEQTSHAEELSRKKDQTGDDNIWSEYVVFPVDTLTESKALFPGKKFRIDTIVSVDDAGVATEPDYMDTHSEWANPYHAPVKEIRMSVRDDAGKLSEGWMLYLIPDAPPEMARIDDVISINRQVDKAGLDESYSPSLTLDRVAAEFGDEAVLQPTSEQCAEIIEALRNVAEKAKVATEGEIGILENLPKPPIAS